MATVLVTGGCGFLGSHIVDAFSAQTDFSIVCISRNPTRFRNPRATYIECDVTNYDAVTDVIDRVKPTVIVHVASPGPFAAARAQHADYLATKHLVDCAHNAPSVKALIYSGSVGAIANVSGKAISPLKEDDAILYSLSDGPAPYARVKGASEAIVLHANAPSPDSHHISDDPSSSKQESLLTTVLRLPGVYGPRGWGGNFEFFDSANTFATRIQLGPNEVLLDFVYVESAALAHVLAAKTLLRGPQGTENRVDGEAFFITDGMPIGFWDWVRMFWKAAGDTNCEEKRWRIRIPWWIVQTIAVLCEVLTVCITWGRKAPPFSRFHIKYMKEGGVFDIRKAKKSLDYEPLVSTEEGVRRTVAWCQEERGRRIRVK
ncbi:C-3 sterol dehydrogenase/C-4 decarboxylase-like protein [Lophiotrema nucula]|uniref:C-3 sterol dehydrogenase/C-4 decarboxylase-like protein n=1 Tax=Lophiotrema nucula TaxID=690887 RepID=A0A6A5Z664_9PLEO|nr:C-3 sterol dehydrogenase/C-4 decarboxylase-like protein [Lophiotrema nucula]